MAASRYETIGRYSKARKIVAALVAADLTDPTLLDLPMFELACSAAGYPSASAATYALVLELLTDRAVA